MFTQYPTHTYTHTFSVCITGTKTVKKNTIYWNSVLKSDETFTELSPLWMRNQWSFNDWTKAERLNYLYTKTYIYIHILYTHMYKQIHIYIHTKLWIESYNLVYDRVGGEGAYRFHLNNFYNTHYVWHMSPICPTHMMHMGLYKAIQCPECWVTHTAVNIFCTC